MAKDFSAFSETAQVNLLSASIPSTAHKVFVRDGTLGQALAAAIFDSSVQATRQSYEVSASFFSRRGAPPISLL
ncbi:hypothetical protein PGT21_008915 [Puccinia graminis f. sp. tritici]|uniref:Uncharacterized protein n=1 Tax=Puccinia graminis f. sp. tritici TaxID=56615 RepID=A0A5B0RVI2_PUCGR|nr:hypothetical protein PGT21_008915 [Puccinia graminis f. sp. tritici]KAA1129438.1 hypothetical protein PGTUg99_003386 [Puccinia graminis f. sp. tritici]